jgi:hypothetical protein
MLCEANNQRNNNAGKGSAKETRFTVDTPLVGDDIMATLCDTGNGLGNAGCVDGVLREIRPRARRGGKKRHAEIPRSSRDPAEKRPDLGSRLPVKRAVRLDSKDFACRETGEAPAAVWRAC